MGIPGGRFSLFSSMARALLLRDCADVQGHALCADTMQGHALCADNMQGQTLCADTMQG